MGTSPGIEQLRQIFSPDILNLLAGVVSIAHASDTRRRHTEWGDIVYAREVGGELREFGLELVVHNEDGEFGTLRFTLRLGQCLEGTFNVCFELAHGVTDRRVY